MTNIAGEAIKKPGCITDIKDNMASKLKAWEGHNKCNCFHTKT